MNQQPTVQPNDSQLWQALKDFSVDEPGVQLGFVKRLAQENRWTLKFAERVFDEYRRFLYLAVAAEHPASPSDAVDQAWHLHLAYTRSYWGDLCGNVLKQRLHHLPTEGGRAEDEKHSDLYRRTLESYEQAFGHQPPTDIWPVVNQIAPKEKFARVRTSDFWMIKKPGATFRKSATAVVVLMVFSGTMAACSSDSGVGFVPILFLGGIIAAVIYAYRKVRQNLGNNSDCSGDTGCSSGGCSSSDSGSGFFSLFSSCSSDSGSSDSSSSDSVDSGSGGDSSSCSSSSCSSSSCSSSSCSSD